MKINGWRGKTPRESATLWVLIVSKNLYAASAALACISFFSLQRNGPDSRCGPGGKKTCRIGERCMCDNDDCSVSYCASETTERRWCMQPCDEQSDCDPDYTCFDANQGGALAVSPADDSQSGVKYCAPNREMGK